MYVESIVVRIFCQIIILFNLEIFRLFYVAFIFIRLLYSKTLLPEDNFIVKQFCCNIVLFALSNIIVRFV